MPTYPVQPVVTRSRYVPPRYRLTILDPGPDSPMTPAGDVTLLEPVGISLDDANDRFVLMGHNAYLRYRGSNKHGGNFEFYLKNLRSGLRHEVVVPEADVRPDTKLPQDEVVFSATVLTADQAFTLNLPIEVHANTPANCH